MRGSNTQVITAFQRAYNLGTWLSVDGQVGPATSAAIARSIRSGNKVSAHFTWREFTCKCGGRYSTCRRVIIDRRLLHKLETYRLRAGPITIVSGYRCPSHNRAVGGATNSQHLYGKASDINGVLSLSQTATYKFNGRGYKGATGRVIHVDVRAVAVTPWRYA